ncbi:MAG: hypothetical protein IK003_03060 [Prevotella sp.]|nr:hypothetical protein [Prevotella sp.]
MKAKLLLIALAFLVCASAYAYNWDEIADSIASQQRDITEEEFHSKIETYRRIRRTKCIKMHYDSIFTDGDTIIIMEYHNPNKEATHSALWVKGNPHTFMTYNRYFDIYKDYTHCYFSLYMRKLCEEWNLAQIRKEELENPPEKPSYVISTRVILRPKGEYLIESIFFQHFYSYPRDRF